MGENAVQKRCVPLPLIWTFLLDRNYRSFCGWFTLYRFNIIFSWTIGANSKELVYTEQQCSLEINLQLLHAGCDPLLYQTALFTSELSNHRESFSDTFSGAWLQSKLNSVTDAESMKSRLPVYGVHGVISLGRVVADLVPPSITRPGDRYCGLVSGSLAVELRRSISTLPYSFAWSPKCRPSHKLPFPNEPTNNQAKPTLFEYFYVWYMIDESGKGLNN